MVDMKNRKRHICSTCKKKKCERDMATFESEGTSRFGHKFWYCKPRCNLNSNNHGGKRLGSGRPKSIKSMSTIN